MALQPYTKENEVCHVEVLELVLYAHNTNGNSFAQLSLTMFKCFFRQTLMVLLAASTASLAYE